MGKVVLLTPRISVISQGILGRTRSLKTVWILSHFLTLPRWISQTTLPRRQKMWFRGVAGKTLTHISMHKCHKRTSAARLHHRNTQSTRRHSSPEIMLWELGRSVNRSLTLMHGITFVDGPPTPRNASRSPPGPQ